MGDIIGQTIAIAALAAAGIISAGDVMTTGNGYGGLCFYDGQRVRQLPAWAGPKTIGALCGRVVALAAFGHTKRPGLVEVWS